MNVSEPFGDRLRRTRRRAGMTAVQLAAKVGVTEAAIRSWESGRTEGPSFVVGLRIAEALVEDPIYLAFGRETSPDPLTELERAVNELDARVGALERPRSSPRKRTAQ